MSILMSTADAVRGMSRAIYAGKRSGIGRTGSFAKASMIGSGRNSAARAARKRAAMAAEPARAAGYLPSQATAFRGKGGSGGLRQARGSRAAPWSSRWGADTRRGAVDQIMMGEHGHDFLSSLGNVRSRWGKYADGSTLGRAHKTMGPSLGAAGRWLGAADMAGGGLGRVGVGAARTLGAMTAVKGGMMAAGGLAWGAGTAMDFMFN